MSIIITEELKHTNTKAILKSSVIKERQAEFDSMKFRLKWFRENEVLINAMPDLPELPLKSYVYPSIGDISFWLPRSQELINVIKGLDWAGHEFTLKSEDDNSKTNGSYELRYSWEHQSWNSVRFHFDATMEGATCVLTKIGEETKTTIVPIYEVTCPEGAKEEIWNG